VYVKGAYIDAKDTVNNWCVGEVIEIDTDKHILRVHFEAWTPKYDEVTFS
jgi:hypothetical protein